MLRYRRGEAQALAADREVVRFLPAGGQPVAVEIEGGGFEIVGVAGDAQDGAAATGCVVNTQRVPWTGKRGEATVEGRSYV